MLRVRLQAARPAQVAPAVVAQVVQVHPVAQVHPVVQVVADRAAQVDVVRAQERIPAQAQHLATHPLAVVIAPAVPTAAALARRRHNPAQQAPAAADTAAPAQLQPTNSATESMPTQPVNPQTAPSLLTAHGAALHLRSYRP